MFSIRGILLATFVVALMLAATIHELALGILLTSLSLFAMSTRILMSIDASKPIAGVKLATFSAIYLFYLLLGTMLLFAFFGML